ncbi:hypothetical protein [Sporosarcina sp. P33]|uniref:hypothetical protein n=1 Tax=Sporosarcina sp. P33 TaxID=1930764 RepID=UPI0009BF2704|nr:hypothetical protein [Sporosarcina sp. P33]ARD47601.1 hypothetical protein SporoP33_04675 [Sporosarcina sp. P33]
MSKSVCIAPIGKPDVAFAELHETWRSESGSWKVEAKVESVESLPKYKVRTVIIYKRDTQTGKYYDSRENKNLKIPQTVLNKYDEFISLAKEVR